MKNKQTILYLITQSEFGGAQKYIFNLIQNLKNDYNIIVAFGEQGHRGKLAQELENINIKYYALPHLKRNIYPISDFLAIIETIRLIKKISPNIIHLNSSKISILGSLASLFIFTNKPQIIYTVHGWVFNEPMPVWKKLFYKYTEKVTASFKDKIICVSEFDRQVAITEKICPENKLITIHNGINVPDFLSKEKAKEEILNINHKIKFPSIVSMGNLYKTKGYKYLIEAMHFLKKEKIDVNLVIMGEGDERKELERLIAKYSLKNVFLLGNINSSSRLLKAFDIYVSSSIKEGLPYIITEAMMAEIPIIATNAGGTSEQIINNKTGLLIESKKPKIIAQKIKELLDNKNLSQKIVKNAKTLAHQEFISEKMITAHRNLINNFIQKN